MKELPLALPNSSSSSSSFSYDSFSTHKWTYDVFLSFRGEDTRNGFTGHLYRALHKKGIHTFIDDRLERGEEITPALFEAIDKSRIAIIILSANYASSTFCLEELVQIFENTEQKGRFILPIFYKVNPSDVRHLRGSYHEALIRHETQFDRAKVDSWKFVLRKVANISGRHFEEGLGYEYMFIEQIVEEVSKRINRAPLFVANYPVGLKSRVEKVISLLDLGSTKEIIMVGIHGIGGIGKTTIACAMYNAIVDQFEDVCFLFYVRERSDKHGLVELQEKLLAELTREKEIKVDHVKKGIPIIRSMLYQKKVLLILDDVNSQKQLIALVGEVKWFGLGSRIIITTRDKDVLEVCGVSRNYEVEGLRFEEALELFSWNAFKKYEVDSRYASVSICATNYCNRLPLALEIVGSNLFNKTQEEWKSALDIYKSILDKNIQSVLEVSYNGLQEKEKEIFLDMACFFNGYNIENVKNIILNGRGYEPQYGIQVLMEKSLIKINNGREVKIHDLMAQMGQEIVRRESPSNPENRSRLWSDKDILSILEDDKGSNKIEFLMLNMSQSKEVLWNGEAFKKMNNLKILIIGNASFSCEPKHLPNTLRVLEWKKYTWSSLPFDFHPKSLGILNLRQSSFTVVKPLKNFESLTEMNLSRSQFLEKVGDISEAVNLRILDISGCEKLIEVHQSVGLLHKLAKLNAKGCTRLSKFPCSIQSASLELLGLTNCVRLQSVPQILGIIENHLISKFEVFSRDYFDPGTLSLSNDGGHLIIDCGIPMLPRLENWNDGIQHFNKFSVDDQENASSAMSVKLDIYGWPGFEEHRHLTNKYFSVWRPYYCHLTQLRLVECDLTDEFFYQRLPWFPSLVNLDLSDNRFTVLPEYMNGCHHLRTLMLDGCKYLREIKGVPPNIELLSTIDCRSLTLQSSKILLSKAFHEDRSRSVIVPGFKIPEWLDHSCMGSEISFWFRNEIPRLLLCFVSESYGYAIHILINGIEFYFELTTFDHGHWRGEIPCISMGDLHEWDKKFKKELKKDEWNHVIISNPGLDIHSMGVHVYKKEKGPNNVRFIDSKRCIIYRTAQEEETYSLQNKFCRCLDMRVCDSIYSHKAMKRLHRNWDNRIYDAAKMPIRIMLAPTQVKLLVWRILPSTYLPLPTCYELFKKKLVKSPMCSICETKFETIEHVFFECSWTRALWFECDLDWTIQDRCPSNSFASWLEKKFQHITKLHPNGTSVTGLMGNIMWVIWKARNECFLKDKPVNPLKALMTAKAMHAEYSCDLSSVQMGMTHNGPAFEASTSTTKPENMKAAKVKWKVKRKRTFLSINEMEPTCDKGIDAENNAKRKREGESNGNIEMEPNCDKENVKGTKVNYKDKQKGKIMSSNNTDQMEPTCDKDNVKSIEVDYRVKPKRKIVSSRDAEKEPTCDKDTRAQNKAKRKRKEERGDNIEVEPNCRKDIPENQTSGPAEVQASNSPLPINSPSPIQEKQNEEVPVTNLEIEDVATNTDEIGEEEEDIFSMLKSLASTGDLDVELEVGNQEPSHENLQHEVVKQTISDLASLIAQDIGSIIDDLPTRDRLARDLQLLLSADHAQFVSSELQAIVRAVDNFLPSAVEQFDKARTVETQLQQLLNKKQKLGAFGSTGDQKKKALVEQRKNYQAKLKIHDHKVEALKLQIANLEKQLHELEGSRPQLETRLKDIQTEEQNLVQQGKSALQELATMMTQIRQKQPERKMVSEAKTSAETKWRDFQQQFEESLSRNSD